MATQQIWFDGPDEELLDLDADKPAKLVAELRVVQQDNSATWQLFDNSKRIS